MTEALSPARLTAGIVLGLIAVAGWGLFNVGTEIGQAQGFRPQDLTLLRYGVAGLVLLPWFLWRGLRLDQWRLIVLALLVGPAFSLVFNLGFRLAPLAHAVVIGPGMSVLVALALVRFVDRQPISALRVFGLALLLAGLLVIGADRGGSPKATGLWAVAGDLCFVISGSLWGTFSWLLGRWRMPPVETTAGVAIYASGLFIPAYLLIWGFPDAPGLPWLDQAVIQGVIAGSGAPAAFAAAVMLLGTGRASVFNALVPPSAVLMAIPVAGILPNPLQWLGVGLATVGLTLSMAIPARRGPGLPRGPRPVT